MSIGPKISSLLILLVAAFDSAAGFDSSIDRLPHSLRWQKGPIKISISSSLTAFGNGLRPGSSVNEALIRSFQKWEEAANVQFDLVSTDDTAISPSGNVGDGVSIITIGSDTENLLAF